MAEYPATIRPALLCIGSRFRTTLPEAGGAVFAGCVRFVRVMLSDAGTHGRPPLFFVVRYGGGDGAFGCAERRISGFRRHAALSRCRFPEVPAVTGDRRGVPKRQGARYAFSPRVPGRSSSRRCVPRSACHMPRRISAAPAIAAGVMRSPMKSAAVHMVVSGLR